MDAFDVTCNFLTVRNIVVPCHTIEIVNKSEGSRYSGRWKADPPAITLCKFGMWLNSGKLANIESIVPQ